MKMLSNRGFCALLTLFTLVNTAFSQYWEEADSPFFMPAPTLVYADTFNDQLLVMGGLPVTLGNQSYLGLLGYHGGQWDTLGWFGNQVKTAIVYHDTLIVAGGFDFMENNTIGQIACYVDGIWHPYGDFVDGFSGGLIQRLRIVDGVLYAMGLYDTADGQLCKGLAQRIGGHWEPVPAWAELDLNAEPWLSDIIRYQGKLMVSGNFYTTGFALSDLAQYNGTTWVSTCNGCFAGGQDGVAALREYQGFLYAAGIFFYATGNAGQGIMRWDGAQWYPLKPPEEGVLQNINYSDQYSPSIFDMQVHDGLMYIGGGFKFVDHVATPAGICAWDGTDFCVLEGEPFSDSYAPFTFFQDTLYGGTGSGAPDITMRGIVRYLGELCANTIGVEEHAAVVEPLQFAWSTTGELAVLGLEDGPHQIEVYDAQGRLVLDRQVQSKAGRSDAVQFSQCEAAVYLVVVNHERTGRLVPIR